MSNLRTLGGPVKRWGLAAIFWIAMTSVVWAQPKEEEEAGKPQPYLLPYVLVILGVGLGLMVICRPSRRQDRTKTEAMAASLTPEQLRAGAKKAPQAAKPRGKELCQEAKNALTLAIVGAVIPVLGLLLGPLALWKSVQARQLIKQNPRFTGDNLAVAGMVVGGVAIFFGLVWLIVLISAMF